MGQRKKPQGGPTRKARVNLVEFQPGDERPAIGIYALDRSNQPIYTAEVGDDGAFEVPADVLDKAYRVVIGPMYDDFNEIDLDSALLYRSERFSELLEAGVLNIPRPVWETFFFVTRCVTGSVRRCRPFPWLIRDLVAATRPTIEPVLPDLADVFPRTKSLKASAALVDAVIAKPALGSILFPWRCDIVCDGVVEVYRRTCCCRPWIIDDPRLPELEDLLDDLLPEVPDIPWPPRPEPDPPPFEEVPFIREGALDEMALNAARDLHAIRSLPRAEVAQYIAQRPYLACFRSCGRPVKVAQGSINPDGKFDICWREPLRLFTPNCHDEYAYVVKQNFGGLIITIYNGLAANQWYHYGDNPTLTTYHRLARACRNNEFPGDGAFALLQDIGDTGSFNLKTPNATGWDRVAAPAYNDGLAFPVPNPADALGKLKNRNWGGDLQLRYHFSETMKGAGAHYYRISVAAADASGAPTGPRNYLSDGLSWKKYVGFDVVPQVMGPFSAGGQDNLFLIPYDADADWQSGQYHGVLKTTDFVEGRYLLTLEVFDSSGQQLRPTGTAGPGTDAPFTFRRWYQEIGPTAEVPFAALTHMLWWDNRSAQARIVDLRRNGLEFNESCLFLEGTPTSTFSVGYYAYHPNPMFLHNHNLWWRRGIGATPLNTGSLLNMPFTDLSPSPDNVLPTGVSNTNTFAEMLQSETKCSFVVNLHANVKTFNGEVTLNGLDDWDQGAFALEIG